MSNTQYYYTVRIKGHKTVRTIAEDSKTAKQKVCQFENVPLVLIASTKKGEPLNFIELPND